MKNVLIRKDGAALAMIIIVMTCGIMLLTTLGHLALSNYKNLKATNTRVNVYYVADYGAQKVVKDIETIIQSAKIYTNQMMRYDLKYGTLTPYEYFLENAATNPDSYVNDYMAYYRDYLIGGSIGELTSLNSLVFVPLPGDIPGAQYKTQLDTTNFDSSREIKITVTGNVNGKYERTIEAILGINPWGYEGNGIEIVPDTSNIEVQEEAYYASPQWDGAISSSGDIIITGGNVTVNGDIHVNGKVPAVSADSLPPQGSDFGGLIVGHGGALGNLTVRGNIITNNYIHTMAQNSRITVTKRNGIADYSNLNQIYNNTVNPEYSEKASNLIRNNNNPLNIGATVGSLGGKQVTEEFINYAMDTFKKQKTNGGCVYANNIQIEKNARDSNIIVEGTAAIYDNVQVEERGNITIGHNFYGFQVGAGNDSYDTSSSIITNHAEGTINFGQRIYNGGVAYVTAYGKPYGGDFRPYVTAETVSLFRNYYAYREPLTEVKRPNGTMFDTQYFPPFSLTFFNTNINDPYELNAFKIAHVFKYNELNTGTTIADGGTAYDKGNIILNSSIYNTASLSNSNADMGYSQGVLIGKAGGTQDFIALLTRDGDYSSYPFIKKSLGSLTIDAFVRWIGHKYLTLMEVKALKANNGDRLTIDQLMDKTGVNSSLIQTTTEPYVIISPGDINVTSSGGNITITGSSINFTRSGPFRGLILSTNGKVTINSNDIVNIEGAVISGCNPNNVGIQISGSGQKNITYDKDMLLSIFGMEDSASAAARKILTSKRGDVEMLKQQYNSVSNPSGFKAAVDSYLGGIDAIETLADMYTIKDANTEISETVSLGTSIVNRITSSGGKNYKIIKWRTIK